MNSREVPVFFYGGLINPRVQDRVGLVPKRSRRAVLRDFAITFEPWVNLRSAIGDRVHGLVMDVTHEVLDRTYSKLAAPYLPWPLACTLADGTLEPALCYIAPSMEPGPIDPAHVEALAEGAEFHGFPSDYVSRIRAFIAVPPINSSNEWRLEES